MRIGVEVGGTFTDLVGFDGESIRITKVRSTPSAPDRGVFAALEESGFDLAKVEDLAHGSTVATNAVLERKGAKLCFVTTAGFRDLLQMQRHDRLSIYDLAYRKPVPVVERRHTYELPERILADGSVEKSLDMDAATKLAEAILAEGYEAVAICFLNAYANPAHEAAFADLLRQKVDGLVIACSSDVAREFREYERASTTALAAFVQPVIDRYLARMERELEARKFGGRLTVMQSNGGRLPAEAMRRNAVTALLSGPAAGVIGAARQVALSGYRNLITFDMGGTSADVCLVNKGIPSLVHQTVIDGLPIQTPMLDIVTVGGGGGSLVWKDDGAMLRVGPRSAGANPGPACYGLGGVEPTITDAQVACGVILPETFLGGRMQLHPEKAREALATVGQHFGMTAEQMADSAIRLVNANIVRAIQLVSTERGRDPRDYVLVPFGGGGPLHAAKIAEELGIETIVIPPNPGVISAYGLLSSDYTKFASVTKKMPLPAASVDGQVVLEALMEELVAGFSEMGVSGRPDISFILDMRYVGQAFEIQVPLKTTSDLQEMRLREAFEEAHRLAYSHGGDPDRAIEIVAFRASASLPAPAIAALRFEAGGVDEDKLLPIYFDGARLDCRHSNGQFLMTGETTNGPLVIGGATSTIFVPPGWNCTLDASHNIVMKRNSK